MTRRKRAGAAPPTDPLLAWAFVGTQALQMLAASAHVIRHRAGRRNTPAQLFEMGNEKVQAAVESSHAIARHWLALQSGAAPALDPWTALVAAAMAPYRRRAMTNARRMRRR